MSRLYVSGPMRGRRLYNFPAFFKAAINLRLAGNEVINPAEKDMAAGLDPSRPLDDQGFDLGVWLRRDFQDVLDCDAIVLLPGWEQSKGACAERVVAQMAGKKIYYYEPDTPGFLRLVKPACEPTISFTEEAA
ncbi:MAG: DUF4406 domain-containing protein [Planctomycetota bacterium]